MTQKKEADANHTKKEEQTTGADKKTKKKKNPSSLFHKSATKKIKPQLIIKPENNSAKRLMWFSVSLFTIVILILWGWSMKINLSNLNFKKTAEGQLLQKSQAEWDRLFNDTQAEQEQAKTTQQIKDNLKQIITALITGNTTSTVGTATSTISTSTPNAKQMITTTIYQ